MISIKSSQIVNASASEVFEAIENVQKLVRFKREIKNFKLVRNETGLQLFDVPLRFLGISFETRLKYTTIPGKYAELKKIKGKLKEYTCTYTVKESLGKTEVFIDLRIKLPYLLFGFILALLSLPIYRFRLKRELRLLRKYFNEK